MKVGLLYLSNQIKKFNCRRVILICITALPPLFSSCFGSTTGGSNAETQASLPAPVEEDSGVTISSPTGAYVIVTGQDAVPAGATVIASVSEGSSAILNVLSSLMPAAIAQSCESTLPTCPEISSDGECQFTADAEGNFTFQLPAALGDEITLSYIDSSSCQEIEFVEAVEIDDSTPTVDYLVQDTTVDYAGRYAVLVGTDFSLSDGLISKLSVLNLDVHDDIQTTELDSTFFPTSVDFFTGIDGSSGTKYLVLNGDLMSAVGEFNQKEDLLDGSLDYRTVLDSSGAIPTIDARFLSARLTDQITSPSCSPIPSAADQFMRLFLSTGSNILYHEFGASLSDADPQYLPTNDGLPGIIFRSVEFSIYNPTVGPLEVESVPFFLIDDSDTLNVVLLLSDSSTGSTGGTMEYYYYFTFTQEEFNQSFCNGYLSKSIDDGFLIASSDSFGPNDFDFAPGHGLSSNNVQVDFLAAFNKIEQESLLIDTEDFNNYVSISFDPSSSTFTTTHSSAEDGQSSMSSVTTIVNTLTEDIIGMQTVTDTDRYVNLFFVGQNFGGSGFLDIFGETGTIVPPIMPSVLYPIDVILDTNTSQVILFDIGLSSSYTDDSAAYDDIVTFIKFYGLE